MRAIAVVNQKGGCGKTTTAVNLAAGLAALGQRTLLVDLDPQAHASLALGRIDDGGEKSLYDVLVDPYLPLDAAIATVSDSLDLVPGNVLLYGIEQVLSGAPQREYRLRRKLEPLADSYAYVVIDTPPAVGLLTINALSAADVALVAVEASYFALHGMAKLFETIEMVRRETHRDIEVRALCTMFDGRTRLAHEVRDEIRRHLGDTLYASVVRVNVKLREAASHGRTIFDYARLSKGAEDYGALAREISTADAGAIVTTRDPIEGALSGRAADVDALLSETRAGSARAVPFSLYAPDARRVELVGEWATERESPTRLVPDPATGIWSAQVSVPPGRHEYYFLVDDVRVADPANARVSIGPTGERSSILAENETWVAEDGE